MLIEWPVFLGVIVMLWLPVTWLYPAVGRERLERRNNSHFRLERMMATWQHWFDLVRAGGGTYFLIQIAVTPNPELESGRFLHLAVIGVVLTLALAIQTIHYKNFIYCTAPVFFAWGICLGLVDLVPAVFAIVFSAIIARMLNHVDLKLPLLAGLLGVVGYLYNGLNFHLILACVLVMVPLILAYSSMSTMICYSRDLSVE